MSCRTLVFSTAADDRHINSDDIRPK